MNGLMVEYQEPIWHFKTSILIINITYADNKTKLAITKIVGPSYSFIERIKLKGIGCSKLQIKESSPDILSIISANQDTAYCNIEMRKNGIVIGFNSTGRIYAWCIPYYRLNIYYNFGKLSIYGPANHIKAIAPFNGNVDKDFIKKILKAKSALAGDNIYE